MAGPQDQDPGAYSGSPFASSPYYADTYNQYLQQKGWGAQPQVKAQMDAFGTDFSQQFQNAVGRPPTADEINQFYQQSVNPQVGTSLGLGGTDPNALASAYIPQAFQSQIQQHQQDQIPKLQTQIQDVVGGVTKNTAQDLANPNSPTYQALSGVMNNAGISPSSGAFQAGAGGVIGQAASQAENQALTGLGFPAIAGMQSPSFQSLAGQGQQAGASTFGNNLNWNQQLQNFNMQADLAKQMQKDAAPGWAEKYAVPLGSAALQGGGAAASGAATSYICLELIRQGLASEHDLFKLHEKVLPAVWTRARAFWLYAKNGRELVHETHHQEVNWKKYRKLFLDDVFAKPDADSAVNAYADAFRMLCNEVNRFDLWDTRVYWKGCLDSLPFLPRVLTYWPFIRSMIRLARYKMLFLYHCPETRHG